LNYDFHPYQNISLQQSPKSFKKATTLVININPEIRGETQVHHLHFKIKPQSKSPQQTKLVIS